MNYYQQILVQQTHSPKAKPKTKGQFAQFNSTILRDKLAEMTKTHKCNECSYTAKKSCALKQHQRTHTGERPFKCTHCNHSTADQSNFKTHLLNVHGVINKKSKLGLFYYRILIK